MKITPNGWGDFQHYKDRNPPWIRLHKKLLDNYEFQRLPVASRALAPMLWLLASESMDGEIDADPSKLAFRLRQPEAEIVDALKPLIQAGFFSTDDDASNALASRKQLAVPETEAETEALQRQSAPRAAAKPPRSGKPKSSKSQIPEDFAISERVRSWAVDHGYLRLREHFEAFVRKCKAKGYAYADWDAALMEAIREDWAKLRGNGRGGMAAPAGESATVGSSEAERTAEYLRSKELTPEERERAEAARIKALSAIKTINTTRAAA